MSEIVLNPHEVVALAESLGKQGNQARLNSGCVCDRGCDSCDRLAEAWEAMREAITCISRGLTNGQKERGETHQTIAREALRLADRVSR